MQEFLTHKNKINWAGSGSLHKELNLIFYYENILTYSNNLSWILMKFHRILTFKHDKKW